MPGGFSDEERERIREGLLEAGRELFARYGIGKTTISELTDRVGIANGTFYQFYDSKLDLYVAVLEREGERILPRVMEPLEAHDDPQRAIEAFLTTLMDQLEENDLIRNLLVDREEMQQFRNHFSEEERVRSRQEDVEYFLPYVRQWYEAGEVRGPDPETVAHAIRAVSMLSLHVDDVGEDHYREVRDTVISAVARGLTETETATDDSDGASDPEDPDGGADPDGRGV